MATIVLNLNNHEKMLMLSPTRRNSMVKQKKKPSWSIRSKWAGQSDGSKDLVRKDKVNS